MTSMLRLVVVVVVVVASNVYALGVSNFMTTTTHTSFSRRMVVGVVVDGMVD